MKPRKPDAWRGSVRIPADVHRKIQTLAKEQSRPFTRQLEVVLREGLKSLIPTKED